MAFQVIEEMADQKAKEMEPVETQIVEIMPPDIENLIYVVRNKQVMVDSDLATLYQVETKALNRAVKRNIKRFPEDFCFQLTTDEAEFLKCQSGTSKIQESEKRMDEVADVRYRMYWFKSRTVISKEDCRL